MQASIFSLVPLLFLVKEAPVVLAQEIIRDIDLHFQVQSLAFIEDSISDCIADSALFLKQKSDVFVCIFGSTCDLASLVIPIKTINAPV